MFFLPFPTRRGLLVLLLAAASTAVAFMNSGLIVAFSAATLGALVISGFVMVFLSCAGMKLDRKIPDGTCGEYLDITFTIRNRLPLFRQSCAVHEKYPFLMACSFNIPALGPWETREVTFSVKAEKRGSFFLNKVYLTTGDPLGLFCKRKCFRIPAHVEIHPRCFALSSLIGTDILGGIPDAEGCNLGRSGKGVEFFGVRPYRIGDEVRHIHWKSTAGKGKLMVREFEASATEQVVILLDTDKKMQSPAASDSNFEFLITCADSIAEFFNTRFCHLAFAAADSRGELCRISGDSSTVRKEIRQALTLLQVSDMPFSTVLAETIENIPPKSSVYLLSMSECAAEYADILTEQECFCNLIFAPAGHFPALEPDKPRIVQKMPLPETLADCSALVSVATFKSGADILEER